MAARKIKVRVKPAEETPDGEELLVRALRATVKLGEKVLREEHGNGGKRTRKTESPTDDAHRSEDHQGEP